MNPRTPSSRCISHEGIHAQNTRRVLMPSALVRLTLAHGRAVAVIVACLANLNERMLLRHLPLRSQKEEMRLEKNNGDYATRLSNVLPSFPHTLVMHAQDPVASTESADHGN